MRKLTESEKVAWAAVCKSVLDSPRIRFKTLMSEHVPSVSKVIDLHGMTQDEAFTNIKSFLLNNRAARQYDVIIITGKGENGTGTLKRLVPFWLSSTLKNYIRSYSTDTKNIGQLVVTLKK